MFYQVWTSELEISLRQNACTNDRASRSTTPDARVGLAKKVGLYMAFRRRQAEAGLDSLLWIASNVNANTLSFRPNGRYLPANRLGMIVWDLEPASVRNLVRQQCSNANRPIPTHSREAGGVSLMSARCLVLRATLVTACESVTLQFALDVIGGEAFHTTQITGAVYSCAFDPPAISLSAGYDGYIENGI